MSAAVISHGDAAPIFEFGEHVFDLVALHVQNLAQIAGDRRLALGGMQDVMSRSGTGPVNEPVV